MLRLTEKLSKEKHCPVYFIVADSDQRSQPKVAASSVQVNRKPLCAPPDFDLHHSCVRTAGVSAHGMGDCTPQPRSWPVVELISAHDGLFLGVLDMRDAADATPGRHL